MRVRKTVSLISSIPNIGTIIGVIMIPIITASVTKNVRKVKTHERNSLIAVLSFSKRYSLNVGINATEIEPSAKSLRNRFGIINATEKASERALVPNRLALTISRRSPKTLETSVKSDSIELFRNMDREEFGISSVYR